jgi:hypothetical protein
VKFEAVELAGRKYVDEKYKTFCPNYHFWICVTN